MALLRVNGRFLSQRITGVQRYARELTRALIDKGVDIEILAPCDAEMAGFEKQVTIVGHRQGHLWEQFDLPSALQARDSPLLINLASLAPIKYGNQLLTLHDVAYLKVPDSFSWRFRAFYRTVIPLMLRRIRLLTTVSEFSRQEIQDAYGRLAPRIEVIPNAVDQRFLEASDESREPRFILAVSSIKRQKNFARLLEAFAGLPSSVDCKLYVVGAPERAFAPSNDESVVDDRIKMLGYVDDDELIELYQRATAFAFPSLYEGFGIPPLEAQSCGCPVIASTAPGVKETLASSALYFDPLNVSDIRSSLQHVIESRECRQRLIEAGFDNVRRFSWDTSAQRLLDAVDTL